MSAGPPDTCRDCGMPWASCLCDEAPLWWELVACAAFFLGAMAALLFVMAVS